MQELLKTGNINGRLCRCLIDTGANRTTVPDRLVPMECFTGKTAKARLANQGIVTLRTATIDLKVDGISKSMEVFVVGEDTKHVLLGKDHPWVRSWIAGKSKQSEWVDDPVPLATIIRWHWRSSKWRRRERPTTLGGFSHHRTGRIHLKVQPLQDTP